MRKLPFVSRWAGTTSSPAPDPYHARLQALADQGRTITYLLYSCIAQLDTLLGAPQPEATHPLPSTRQGAGRAVVRRRHAPRQGPTTARRSIPMLLVLTLVLPVLLIIGVFSGATVYEHFASGFVPPEQIAGLNAPSQGSRIYDRNGELLYEYVDEQRGIRLPVELEHVADSYLAATIATEDDTFFSNPGLNHKGLLRAVWENLSPLATGSEKALAGSGGSSITQQLIKNIYIPEAERADRSLDRKLKEAAFALEITSRYAKAQILQWYVNEISYGGLYYGVEAAARGYFGKPAAELSLAEAALLAGIPQSPAMYDPRANPAAALARRNEVLDLMGRASPVQIGSSSYFSIERDTIEAAKAMPLQVQPQVYDIQAPHFVLENVTPKLEALFGREALLRDGLVITTSLDLSLQRRAEAVLERWISEFEESSNSRNGALMVLDAPTGEVRVWIGSRSYEREDIDGEVDNLTALNSPGSSFKPFVFLTAFEKLGWTPSTILEDTPTTYREADGSVFEPRNPNRSSYLGRVTVRDALGNSLNVPPFKTALQLGVPTILDAAKRLGFTTLSGSYGPAIAIGGVDLNAEDLTFAYSVLANNGAMAGVRSISPEATKTREIDPVVILNVKKPDGSVLYNVDDHRAREQIAQPEHAYMVSSILSDPSAQCVTFGCGGLSVPGRVAAVKTGTSEPFDPNGPDAGKIGETWAFGYTPDFVVGVWAGNSNNAPVVNIYSTSISYRVMRDTLELAYAGSASGAFPRPELIEERRACNGAKCRNDLFIKGIPTQATPTPERRQTPAPTP